MFVLQKSTCLFNRYFFTPAFEKIIFLCGFSLLPDHKGIEYSICSFRKLSIIMGNFISLVENDLIKNMISHIQNAIIQCFVETKMLIIISSDFRFLIM